MVVVDVWTIFSNSTSTPGFGECSRRYVDFSFWDRSQVHTKGDTPTGRENNGAVVIKNHM